MTSTVTELTLSTIMLNSYDALSATFGITAILLLVHLLLQKELLRGYGGDSVRGWMQTLNIVIMPLGMMFAVIMIIRLLDLIRRAALN